MRRGPPPTGAARPRLHQLLTRLRRRIQTRTPVPSFDLQQRQQVMQDRRQRLDPPAQMPEGPSHLQPDAGPRLDARIDALETQLQRIAEVPPVRRAG